MKSFLAFFFFVLFLRVQGQTIEEASKLYASQSYKEALEMCGKMMNNSATAAFANGLTGRIYADQNEYRTAAPYLQKAIELDEESSYISGWSYAYLGRVHVMLGETEKGKSELNKAISLNKTDNSVKYAEGVLSRMDNIKLEPKWITIESEHFIFKFQDTAGLRANLLMMVPRSHPTSAAKYIQEHEQAFARINKIFHADLQKKITFFVWTDDELAKKILGKELGFATPTEYKCNADYRQTIGHEMTHVLSYWGWGQATLPENMTRLINEGVAVAFDLSRGDKYERARNAVTGENIHSILDVWKDNGMGYQKVLYPLGGAFLTYLYKKSTPEQFKSIIKNQTIENAQNTYGIVQFGIMMTEFNNMIGLK
jgi:tetratricopeptide (TPR) repeat protein